MVAVASAASERQWRVAKGNHGRARPGLTWVASTSADGGGAWSSRYRLWNLSQTHHERSHTFQFFLASKHLLTDERLYTTLPVLSFWLHASRRSGFGVSRSISTQILPQTKVPRALCWHHFNHAIFQDQGERPHDEVSGTPL